MQFASSAQAGPGQVMTSAQSFDDVTLPANPVDIELFTSQGCASYFPPPPHADLLARRLAKDDSLLVTYWDRLGWKDTLAREDNTRLQRAYAEKSDAGVGVCTPQIAANGGGGAVGSWENDIRWLVRGATGQAP
ncbi:DUF1223 domain-containing protein [Parasphingorhabdus sp.]|uniref:DUF1223 domain-containing protein n=1 Tax=Parasphingorhabdus sp. TaxID=2709688 RepID=UPI00309DDCB1